MSYSGSTISYSDPQPQETATSATTTPTPPKESAELKLYQAFIFSVPIFFTFVLLFVFYLFYLRRRGVDWDSLRMRNSSSLPTSASESDDSSRVLLLYINSEKNLPFYLLFSNGSLISYVLLVDFALEFMQAEMGVKKEVREMLPIIVFKESFSVNDTQCSVCLGDYQAEERLLQIPTCGHTFHMDCIDSWLSSHATCPLCRQSLLVSAAKASRTEEVLVVQIENNNTTLDADAGETFPGNGSLRCENGDHHCEEVCNTDERILIRDGEECNHDIDDGRE